MNYKSLGILLLILLAGLGYWWFGTAPKTTTYTREALIIQPKEGTPETNLSPVRETAPAFFDITTEDCRNECISLQDKNEPYAYCRNVCGLSPEPGTVNEDKTTSPPALQESYTIKEKAIRERNLELCANIQDAHLRKSCEVRVTEDLLE